MRLRRTTASPTRRRTPVVAAAAVLGLAVAGCGSSGSSTTQSKTTASAPASSSTATGTTTASSPAAASTQSGGTTAPGTNLALGAPALVDYKPGVNNNSPTYRLQVTAVSIEKGSQAELAGVELEKSEQGKTPYYVKLQIRNEGAGNASAEDGAPETGFQAIDDRGQQGQELTVLGTYRPCPSGTPPKQFTRGVSYNTCQIFLVGSGGSIVKEQWIGSVDKYSENPIVWKAG